MPTKNKGKALAIPENLCYNARMETNPLVMTAVDMLHEATLCTYDADNSLYRLRKWTCRAGISPELTSQLCGRIAAAQDILAAVRKELDATKVTINETPQE
jgi:hypothetical protein